MRTNCGVWIRQVIYHLGNKGVMSNSPIFLAKDRVIHRTILILGLGTMYNFSLGDSRFLKIGVAYFNAISNSGFSLESDNRLGLFSWFEGLDV
jgi:hypothetical protein